MLKHGDYLKPFTREDAMDIIAFAHMAGFPMHSYRASDHRALIFGPDALYFNQNNGLSGGTGPGTRPLNKREFLTHIANSDVNERFEACTMYKLGIEPGAIVKPDSGPAFIVPPYTMWTALRDAYAWMTKDGAPHEQCWLNQHLGVLVHSHNVHPAGVELSELHVDQWVRFKDNRSNAIFKIDVVSHGKAMVRFVGGAWHNVIELVAVSAAKVPQPVEDTEIRVGDTVERIVADDHGFGEAHYQKGFIGVVTEVGKDPRVIYFGNASGDTVKYRKIKPNKPAMDDVIRVGDTVLVLEDDGSRLHAPYIGKHVVVVEIEPHDSINDRCDIVRYSRGVGLPIGMFRYRFRKVKAGGPVSTNQQQPHEYQVSGTTIQKREPVEGRCVQRPVPGRSCAVGSRHQGHGARAAVSRAQCRYGTIRFTVQWSQDPPAGR